MDSVRKYQEALCVLANDAENTDINILRIGTILSFSVIGKILHGKYPKDFTGDDWKDVADKVADYGVIEEQKRYTEFVFNLFAAYIDFSVNINKEVVNKKAGTEIKGLASEIRDLTGKFEEGKITEPDYVDRCLWTSFEAMIKLLAAYKTKGLCAEYAGFIQALADMSVQYARLKMYEKELNLLNGYLEGQQALDKELQAKYDEYVSDLKTESEEFDRLIENAFSDDFENMLKNSVSLARKAGVDEKDILDSKEKIDSFFLD